MTLKRVSVCLLSLLFAQGLLAQTYSERLLQRAEAGNAEAQNGLADCYYKGSGVGKNYTEAFVWYNR